MGGGGGEWGEGGVIKRKLFSFFWQLTKSSYPYIYNRLLFSNFVLNNISLILENLGLQIKVGISICRKQWLANYASVNRLLFSKLLSQ